MEKQRWEESEKERQKKKDPGARKGRKVAKHCVFFQCVVAPEERQAVDSPYIWAGLTLLVSLIPHKSPWYMSCREYQELKLSNIFLLGRPKTLQITHLPHPPAYWFVWIPVEPVEWYLPVTPLQKPPGKGCEEESWRHEGFARFIGWCIWVCTKNVGIAQHKLRISMGKNDDEPSWWTIGFWR